VLICNISGYYLYHNFLYIGILKYDFFLCRPKTPNVRAEKFTFLRDGIGRQSMSEKRKGYVDPNQSELYLEIKQFGNQSSENHQEIGMDCSSNYIEVDKLLCKKNVMYSGYGFSDCNYKMYRTNLLHTED